MKLDRSFNVNVYDLNAILHPGSVFDHPRDVLADAALSRAEKRAILASWASDAAAVTSCPSLRAPLHPRYFAEHPTRRKAGPAQIYRAALARGLIPACAQRPIFGIRRCRVRCLTAVQSPRRDFCAHGGT